MRNSSGNRTGTLVFRITPEEPTETHRGDVEIGGHWVTTTRLP